MVRRVKQSETFHGTAAGQVPNVKRIRLRFDLSERQAQCVALLRMGTTNESVAELLGISMSTLETHLADLRRIFEQASTSGLLTELRCLIADHEIEGFHSWPVQTNAPSNKLLVDSSFAAKLSEVMSVEQALEVLREALVYLGVKHVYYCYLPHSVQGFFRGDFIDVFLGPPEIERTFRENDGLLGQPSAQLLLDTPGGMVLLPIDTADCSDSLAAFYGACLRDEATHLLSLGFPAGPAYVGMSMILGSSEADLAATIDNASAAIRSLVLAVHAKVITNGALAARVRLTVKERNALSALALGKRAAEAAKEVNVSERAFAKLTASARAKLKARTNAEAVGKAALINALVFL